MSTPEWLRGYPHVDIQAPNGFEAVGLGPVVDGHFAIMWSRNVVNGNEYWSVLGVESLRPVTKFDCERILRAVEGEE